VQSFRWSLVIAQKGFSMSGLDNFIGKTIYYYEFTRTGGNWWWVYYSTGYNIEITSYYNTGDFAWAFQAEIFYRGIHSEWQAIVSIFKALVLLVLLALSKLLFKWATQLAVVYV
jgi:hypothetical protein